MLLQLTHHVEGLTQRLLHPLLQTVISPSQTFDASQRQKLAMRCLDLVMLLCTRLGRPLAQERLMPLVQTFFSYFNCISRPGSTQTTDGADNSATAPPTSDTTSSTTAAVDPDGALLLDAVFTPTLASFSYQHFCQLIGQETLRRHLSNIQLIEELMYEREHDVRSLPMLFSTFADEMAPSGSSTSTGTTTTEVAAATPSVPPHAESDTIPNTALPAGLASTVSPGPSEGFSPGTNGDSVSLAPEVLLEYEQVDVLEGGSTQGGSLRADENVSVKTADAYERWAQGWMSYWRHHGDRVHAQVHPDFDFQSRLLQVGFEVKVI